MLDSIVNFFQQHLGIHLMYRDVILFGLAPYFVILFFIEYRYLIKTNRADYVDNKESILNFSLGATYQIAEGIFNLLFLAVFLSWVQQYQWLNLPINTVFSALILLVLQEFCYYWYHRASHRVRWFWCAHVVHHSSERMNLSTAMRQSVMYPFAGSFLFFTPLVLLGFSAEAVFASYAVNLGYQYLIHTQVVDKLHPSIEFIFNTPSHHRAHHGRNAQYIDKNFGGILIIFDRLFGTFVEESEADPVDYGIPNQIHTNNWFVTNFHEWRDMFSDAAKPGKLTDRLKHLIMPPEWKR